MIDFLQRIMIRSFSEPGPGAVQPRLPARFETLDGVAGGYAETGEPERPSDLAPARQAPDRGSLQGGPTVNLFRQPGNGSDRASSSETRAESPVHPVGNTGSGPDLSSETRVIFHEIAPTQPDEGPNRELLFPEPSNPSYSAESPTPTIVRLERVEQLLPPAFGPAQEPFLREPSIRENPFLEIPQSRIPEVRISIGRIEVHAPPAATSPVRPVAPRHAPLHARPVRSLDDYLAGRREGGTPVPRQR